MNVVLDKAQVKSKEKLWFHPLSNEASLAITNADFLIYIRESGRVPWVLDIESGKVTQL